VIVLTSAHIFDSGVHINVFDEVSTGISSASVNSILTDATISRYFEIFVFFPSYLRVSWWSVPIVIKNMCRFVEFVNKMLLPGLDVHRYQQTLRCRDEVVIKETEETWIILLICVTTTIIITVDLSRQTVAMDRQTNQRIYAGFRNWKSNSPPPSLPSLSLPIPSLLFNPARKYEERCTVPSGSGRQTYSDVKNYMFHGIKHTHKTFCLELTRLFSYRPAYQAWTSITARGVAEGSYRPRAWYMVDMKTAVW